MAIESLNSLQHGFLNTQPYKKDTYCEELFKEQNKNCLLLLIFVLENQASRAEDTITCPAGDELAFTTERAQRDLSISILVQLVMDCR